MKSELLLAISQLAAERGLPKEVVLRAVELAILSAYKKSEEMSKYDLSAHIDPKTGEISVFIEKKVTEEVKNPDKEISLEEAVKIKPDAHSSLKKIFDIRYRHTRASMVL